MATKIWNLRAGQITSVLYERGKNRKILNLRNPVDADNKKVIDEIDVAMGVLNRYVVSIVDADRESGYDKSVDNKNARGKVSNDEKLDLLQGLASDHNTDSDNEREEANDKVGLLHRKDDNYVGKKTQRLIDANTEKDGGSKEDINARRELILVPKNEVKNTRNRIDSKAYNNYDVAFQHVIPELLDRIKKSDKGVMAKISDIVKELGKDFEKKSDVSIYTGIRHILFKYGVKVEQCTFKEIDQITHKGKKGLRMSVFQVGDKPPCSIKKLKKYR